MGELTALAPPKLLLSSSQQMHLGPALEGSKFPALSELTGHRRKAVRQREESRTHDAASQAGG